MLAVAQHTSVDRINTIRGRDSYLIIAIPIAKGIAMVSVDDIPVCLLCLLCLMCLFAMWYNWIDLNIRRSL